jgi:chromosome segregation ATPase
MNDEELRKQMEFIADQLATVAVRQDRTEEIINRLANASLDRITSLDEKVSALADAQIKTEENLATLAASQSRTDDRLNAFIAVAERFVSERGGEPQG